MNIPCTVVATSGVYQLTAHERTDGGCYGLVEAERIDHAAISAAEQVECDLILDLFESEAWGNC
jgi:hypothetical protein